VNTNHEPSCGTRESSHPLQLGWRTNAIHLHAARRRMAWRRAGFRKWSGHRLPSRRNARWDDGENRELRSTEPPRLAHHANQRRQHTDGLVRPLRKCRRRISGVTPGLPMKVFDAKAQFAARMKPTSSHIVFASFHETTSSMKTEAVSPRFQESALLSCSRRLS
jgi:hypothetical protein